MRGQGSKGKIARLGVVVAALAVLALPAAGQAFPKGSNGRIAFERQAPGVTDVLIANADGSGVVNLTNNTGAFHDFAPSFSPTGRQILFNRQDDAANQTDIWLMDADGSDKVNLFGTTAADEFDAVFSPDGRSILYTSCVFATMTCNVFSKTLAGPPVQLTFDGTEIGNFDAQYSPDGRKIVWRRSDASQRDIWIMNVDGSGQTNITPNTPGDESRPRFTPDGRKIVFDDTNDLFSMAPDGSGRAFLTQTPTVDEFEVWPSGDGRKLTFAFCAVNCVIEVSDAAGGGAVPITTRTPGVDDRAPTWETVQKCDGRRATIVGDDGPDKIKGTKKKDVIVANGGKDKIKARGGNDRICGGKGKDRISGGGGGGDKCVGGKGRDSGSDCEKGKL